MANKTLGQLQCETDAAWKSFCRNPTDETWDAYIRAKASEDAAEETERFAQYVNEKVMK